MAGAATDTEREDARVRRVLAGEREHGVGVGDLTIGEHDHLTMKRPVPWTLERKAKRRQNSVPPCPRAGPRRGAGLGQARVVVEATLGEERLEP